MKRRPFFAATGIALSTPLSGCPVSIPGNDADTNDGTSSVQIVSVDADSPPVLPVSPEVFVINERATEASPATLSVSWENVDDDPVRLGEANSIVFSATPSDDQMGYLLAVDQLGNREDSVAFDKCWYIGEELVFDGDYEMVDLASGETHDAEPALYASSDHCLSNESYRFETTITVEERYDQEKMTGEWGFVLNIRTE